MSCEDNVCGTGGWTGPKPGDPDNALTLRANAVYGGINVSWSFPTVNPQAVAHTILYRGTNNVFEQAVEQARVGGNIYFDALNPTADTEYWYWIRVRTVNGTLNDVIGPVSAIARPRGEQTLESLTGLINNGVLAQSLKESIAGINLQGQQLLAEIQDRINSNEALAAAIALVQSGAEQAMTFVQQEITQRTEGDSAIVTMVNNLAAANEQSLAVILQQLQTLVTNDGAQASQISTLFVQTNGNQAAIQNEAQVRSTNDSALASQISTLTARVGSAEATIRDEQTVRANADTALASRTTGVESSLYGNVATGQIGLTTKVTTLDGKVTSIGALYTAKVQVNDLIGGFGVYNDGRTVEAGFDVDRFWVGRTGPDKVKPFIIDNGIVYINKARIRDADIDTLKIAGNAITIPIAEARYDTISGNGGQRLVMNRNITLPYGGTVIVICTCAQSSGSGAHWWNLSLRINGTEVANAAGAAPSDSVALSGSMALPAGTHSIELWQNSGSDSRVINRNFTILGAMR